MLSMFQLLYEVVFSFSYLLPTPLPFILLYFFCIFYPYRESTTNIEKFNQTKIVWHFTGR